MAFLLVSQLLMNAPFSENTSNAEIRTLNPRIQRGNYHLAITLSTLGNNKAKQASNMTVKAK